LRHEFVLRETSVAEAGLRRASSETARHYLHAIAAEADQNQRDPATEIDVLLELYERARYSEQEIHWDEVAHFKSLRKNWVATLRH
jgi:hypothetical protein